MKTKKIFLGGLAGGTALFFLGWLVWGILLAGYSTANFNQCMMKPMEEMVWWAIILANLATGLLLSLVFTLSDTKGVKDGALLAGLVGFLVTTSYDLGNYSMSTMFNSLTVVGVDILVNVLVYMAIGAVIALVTGKKQS